MQSYFWVILQGAVLTVGVSLMALLVAILFGLAGAAAKLSGRPVLVGLATFYTTIIRGIPDLVLMLLVFYGGTIGINTLLEKMGSEATVDIEPFMAGVLTIGFIYGAYMTETFRGAILAIPPGQMEAGRAYGMGTLQIFMRITLPQMVRLALPGFTNNWLVLMKATALVSLLGLQDMTYLAKQAGAAARGDIANAPLLFFAFTAFIYLMFTTVSMLLLRMLEKKYSMGVRRGSM